jgi:3-deoxy-manno-octulosonate cytidylyltransferase (CMP-KDO synthetase)
MAGRVAAASGIIAIVPARFDSVRLPGKPLADIAGVPMIVRVLQGISGSVDRAVAATDDKRIMDTVLNAGYEAVYTGAAESGTERVFKAWKMLGSPGETIINVQGDEPLVNGNWIESMTDIGSEDGQIVTLARQVPSDSVAGPDSVKVVLNGRNEALYFSRALIPSGSRDTLEHIGVYSFNPGSLEKCVSAGTTCLSRTERLEQLAWLECGITIRVVTGDFPGISVDTEDDLDRAVKYFSG